MKTFATLALLGFASAVKLHDDLYWIERDFEYIFGELNDIWDILEKNGLGTGPQSPY